MMLSQQQIKKIFTLFLVGIITTTVLYAQVPVNGLIAYYPFCGNADDRTGSFDGTISNVILTTDRFGNTNGAYQFSGSGYIGLGNVMNNTFAGPGKKFTISAWIKPDALMSNNVIFGKKTDAGCSGDQRQFVIHLYNEKVHISYSDLQGSSGRFITGNTIIDNLNLWYHVVVSYDGSINTNNGLDRVKMYINNVQEITTFSLSPVGATIPDIQPGLAHAGIGSYLDNIGIPCQPSTNFKGKIDDVRIYNRVLNTNEITALYTDNVCCGAVYDTTHVTVIDTLTIDTVSVYDTTFISVIDTLVIDTVTVYDTTYVSVTDTLIIHVPEIIDIIEIKIYPNPAGNHLFVRNESTVLRNYRLKIVNTLSQEIFNSLIDQELFDINISTLSRGTYFVMLYDPGDHLIEVKKIVLQ